MPKRGENTQPKETELTLHTALINPDTLVLLGLPGPEHKLRTIPAEETEGWGEQLGSLGGCGALGPSLSSVPHIPTHKVPL